MELYLAIIQTYLSVSLTAIVIRIWKQKKQEQEVKEDIDSWKNEVRKNFDWLRRLHFKKK